VRVSIVNPAKKKTAKKATKKTSKPWEKGLRAARKARKAVKKASTPAPKKKRKASTKKAKKATKAAAKPKRKKAAKKAVKKATSKPRAKKKAKKAKVAHKPKKKASKRSKKVITKSLGKRTRPVMYKKGTQVKHSPASKFAKKGFRFNPGLKTHMVKIGTFKSYVGDVKRQPIPHMVGMAGGFVSSGYIGGKIGKMVQDQTRNEIYGQIGSVAGNIIGTEVPAMFVHWGLPKIGMGKYAVPIARGMRFGGYIALGLNVFTLALKVLKVPVPFRALGEDATMKEFMLSGIGDVDLLTAGISGVESYDNTTEYAALDDESAGLIDEITALSEYIDGDSDDFAGLASEAASGSLTDL
jgi:hypothetical protein